jgi:stress response protein YsnF
VAESGRVRVRSYVVETPVQEQVTLRDERVQVERRPVDRAPTPGDERLWAERTIEATERGEEAVVSKDVRVKEEIGIRKEVEQRTETVSDKVRHTEVEVEDARGQVSRTGTTDPTRR